jgi:hypothetical protein
MLNMQERARLIDGHLSVQSKAEPPKQGTAVTLRVPLPSLDDYDTRPIPTVDHNE